MFYLDTVFLLSLARSVAQGALVGSVVLALGWPAGVAAGLWDFPARRALILLAALPLLLPSFLISIGLSLLWRSLSGLGATVWAFACIGTPLVFFAALAAMRTVTRGQADAARLAGGERLLFQFALRATMPVAALAAVLGAVLTLADVGPGAIFGWHSASGEMLISFAARYDLALATRQAMTLAVVAAVCAWPVVWRLTPTLTTSVLARDTTKLIRSSRPQASLAFAGLALGIVVLPLAGLFRPLFSHEWPLARAWSEVVRTAADTALYAVLAATLAIVTGFAIAGLARRNAQRQRFAVAAALAIFALPPVLLAFWLIPFSSRLTVGIALALRCLPVGLLFGLRAFGAMPPSWSDAATVHRVPALTFARRVTMPWLARWAAPTGLLAALIATAEVGVVLLLYPPGHGTLPLAIFTIMANAPEALVAALCLLYAGLATMLGGLAAVSRPAK